MKPLALVGIPYDLNSSFLSGAALAPGIIRQMEADGSANEYSEDGSLISQSKTYTDTGDLHFESLERSEVFTTIADGIGERLKNYQVLALGGDHSVSFPVLAAHARHYPELNVLHIDAHADLYENFEGNYYSHASPFARALEQKLIRNLTQVGIRTLNPHQREQARKFGVAQHEMKDFTLDFVRQLKAPLYISMDMDALDPAYAPGVSHHEPGGLSTRQVLEIIQRINCQIVGADIVEYNPHRDLHQMTARVAYKIMKELMAKMMKGA